MYIIGEKINGFIPRTLQAINDRDEAYIRKVAIGQSENGASFIDVCAGVAPEIEREVLVWLIDIVLDACDTPLCLDSSDVNMLVDMFNYVQQKATGRQKDEGMINSVSMEEGKCEVIFPVIAEYTGWSVVALTCNNDGIPDDPPTKLVIARQMVELAASYGIVQDRLFIDPLVTTLATKGDSLQNFTEGIALIKEAFPQVHFTSGLSNISFGMPFRKVINTQFLCLAMAAGMDSAIMDPMSKDMLGTLYATNALLGEDEYCLEYLSAYRDGLFG